MRPRAVALGLGAAYALVTALELVVGSLAIGSAQVLERTTKGNLLHWVLALALLGAYFAGAGTSRVVLRIAGVALAALAVSAFAAASAVGGFLGFPGEIPAAYALYHAVAAGVALSAAFSRAPASA